MEGLILVLVIRLNPKNLRMDVLLFLEAETQT